MEGIKACQIAGQSIGKYGKEGDGKSRDAMCRKLACCLCVSILAIPNRRQKTLPLPIRASDQVAPPQHTGINFSTHTNNSKWKPPLSH